MNIEIQEILTQSVAFLGLWFLLKKFAWDKILTLLDERQNKIQASFDDIESKTQSLDSLKQEYELKLKDIENTAKQKLNEAIVEGQKLAAQIQDKARLEAKNVIEKSKETLALEVAKARVDLRNEIVGLAIHAAEKVMSKEIDAKKHETMVIEFIDSIQKKA